MKSKILLLVAFIIAVSVAQNLNSQELTKHHKPIDDQTRIEMLNDSISKLMNIIKAMDFRIHQLDGAIRSIDKKLNKLLMTSNSDDYNTDQNDKRYTIIFSDEFDGYLYNNKIDDISWTVKNKKLLPINHKKENIDGSTRVKVTGNIGFFKTIDEAYEAIKLLPAGSFNYSVDVLK